MSMLTNHSLSNYWPTYISWGEKKKRETSNVNICATKPHNLSTHVWHAHILISSPSLSIHSQTLLCLVCVSQEWDRNAVRLFWVFKGALGFREVWPLTKSNVTLGQYLEAHSSSAICQVWLPTQFEEIPSHTAHICREHTTVTNLALPNLNPNYNTQYIFQRNIIKTEREDGSLTVKVYESNH